MNIEKIVAIGSDYQFAQSLGARCRNIIQDLMNCPGANLTTSELIVLAEAREIATRVWGTHTFDRAILFAKQEANK